jgi:hypothetical protein
MGVDERNLRSFPESLRPLRGSVVSDDEELHMGTRIVFRGDGGKVQKSSA